MVLADLFLGVSSDVFLVKCRSVDLVLHDEVVGIIVSNGEGGGRTGKNRLERFYSERVTPHLLVRLYRTEASPTEPCCTSTDPHPARLLQLLPSFLL